MRTIDKVWQVRGVWLILGKIGLRMYAETTKHNARKLYRQECREF